MDDTIRIHGLLKKSRANGPGTRAVVWFQGCSMACSGCFNPGAKDPMGGELMGVDNLFKWILSIKGIDGISISGGEPSDQMEGLLSLLKCIRKGSSLSVLLFSGRYLKEIREIPRGPKILRLADVLVDGPYDPDSAGLPGVWPSSAGQKIHFLTNRYKISDFAELPDCEVVISGKGEVVESGMGII